ncbi:MAG: c-type cytochrome domain-containing protein, partial [Opitutales bacterium]
MRVRPLSRRSLVCAALLSVCAQAQEKLTYDDHVRPLLENKCFSCHNPDKKKGGLELTSYAGLVDGGSGGAVIDPGNPSASRLWTCSSKKEEPFMPPEGAPLDAKDLATLSKWIEGGALQSKNSVARKSSRPKVELAVIGSAGKPEGPAARPEHVLLEPVVVTPRTTAVVAMAASPWTSLLAVAGQKQVLLYDTDTRELAGILPYPEGYARSLKFSANGSLLVLGGGRGGKFGHAVVWDVRTGRRIAEAGKEFDQIMSADISPDHRRAVIATNTKKVKCYDLASGEELYLISKHTEWVTGADFSPDGVLLATSDRNGNVMVWEADNGGEFFNLGTHAKSVTGLAWRADSDVLASCSADGTVSVWEMKNGKRVSNWTAHGGGVEGLSFTPDGRLVTCGQDGKVALWSIDGKKLGESQPQGDVVSSVVALHDGKHAVSGNWLGEVKFIGLTTGQVDAQVSSNPPRISERMAEAERRIAELAALIASSPVTEPTPAELAARKLSSEAEKEAAALLGKIKGVEKERDDLKARHDKAPEKDRPAIVARRAELSKVRAVDQESLQKILHGLRDNSSSVAWLKADLAELEGRIAEMDKGAAYWQGRLAKDKVQAESSLAGIAKARSFYAEQAARTKARLA